MIISIPYPYNLQVDYIRLSTDTKPKTAQSMSILFERDTGLLYLWDNTEWVLQEQSTLSDDANIHDVRHDYVAGSLVYRGVNVAHKAVTTSATWYIKKYTYSADGVVRIEGPLLGAWSLRTALSWG